jgi:uncharacterized membrane protein YdjX (TVP38/TMEM64 family)
MDRLSTKLFGIAVSRWLILAGVGLALLAVSVIIRDRLNIEWSVFSLRDFVETLGVWGPLAFIGILTFRFLFLIPTGILLLGAGILFGPAYGTLYAGIGMFLSGMLKYLVASIIGRDAILKQLPTLAQGWLRSMADKKMSAWGLAGICAYPFFPKHVFQFAAILSGMSLAAFVPSVLAGSFVRAAIFANLGEAIYSGAGLIAATGLLLAALALPLAIAPWRRWLLAPLKPDTPAASHTEK